MKKQNANKSNEVQQEKPKIGGKKSAAATVASIPESHRMYALLRLHELAIVINVPARTLARWTADKRIPSYKIGSSRFYKAKRVLDALEDFEVK